MTGGKPPRGLGASFNPPRGLWPRGIPKPADVAVVVVGFNPPRGLWPRGIPKPADVAVVVVGFNPPRGLWPRGMWCRVMGWSPPMRFQSAPWPVATGNSPGPSNRLATKKFQSAPWPAATGNHRLEVAHAEPENVSIRPVACGHGESIWSAVGVVMLVFQSAQWPVATGNRPSCSTCICRSRFNPPRGLWPRGMKFRRLNSSSVMVSIRPVACGHGMVDHARGCTLQMFQSAPWPVA